MKCRTLQEELENKFYNPREEKVISYLQWHPPQTKSPWPLHLGEFGTFRSLPLHWFLQSSQDTSRVSLSLAKPSCNSIFTLAFCFSKQNFSFTLKMG